MCVVCAGCCQEHAQQPDPQRSNRERVTPAHKNSMGNVVGAGHSDVPAQSDTLRGESHMAQMRADWSQFLNVQNLQFHVASCSPTKHHCSSSEAHMQMMQMMHRNIHVWLHSRGCRGCGLQYCRDGRDTAGAAPSMLSERTSSSPPVVTVIFAATAGCSAPPGPATTGGAGACGVGLPKNSTASSFFARGTSPSKCRPGVVFLMKFVTRSCSQHSERTRYRTFASGCDLVPAEQSREKVLCIAQLGAAKPSQATRYRVCRGYAKQRSMQAPQGLHLCLARDLHNQCWRK